MPAMPRLRQARQMHPGPPTPRTEEHVRSSTVYVKQGEEAELQI